MAAARTALLVLAVAWASLAATSPPAAAEDSAVDAQARTAELGLARIRLGAVERELAAAEARNTVSVLARDSARRDEEAAAADLAKAHRLLEAWAVSAYMGSGNSPLIQALVAPEGAEGRRLKRVLALARLRTARDEVAAATGALTDRQVATVRAEDETRRARADLDKERQRRDQLAGRVFALASGVALSSIPDSGPSILGSSALTATEIAAWFRSARPHGGRALNAPVEDVARFYIEEGQAEGVRGDIAFAQAILETGAFTSGHSSENNYAGIGAYDTCSPECGFGFATPLLGVRAQIQLLRIYASPGLRASELAHAPDARLVPEKQGARGCCATWPRLTGTWATSEAYGVVLLQTYNEMLSFALTGRDRPVLAPA